MNKIYQELTKYLIKKLTNNWLKNRPKKSWCEDFVKKRLCEELAKWIKFTTSSLNIWQKNYAKKN